MKKSKIIVLIAIFTLVIGGLVFWKFSPNSKLDQIGLVNKSRNLTLDQQKFYLDRIQKANDFAKTLNPSDVNYKQNLLNNYIYLGQQYFGLGELQKSKEMYEKAIPYNPSEVQSYVGLALVYEDAGDFNNQTQTLKKAVELAPQNSDVWIRYLNVRKQTGTTNEEMNDLYNTALTKTNRLVDIVISYANFQAGIGNTDIAIKLWKEAIAKYPENSTAYQEEINKLKKK